MQAARIRIGTRGSPLALAQANEVSRRLQDAHGLAASEIAINIIKTTGDRILDRPLAEVGGKGLFTKELEDALLNGEIDLAVHSMKDMQTVLPDGLVIAATLPREDVRDAFISLNYAGIEDLPQGAVVGTSSLRRQAQLLNLRPDLQVVGFRGNVQTRLTKLEQGVADATFLAVAGLKRLGMEARITSAIPLDRMLPAVAQGAIGIEIRAGDGSTRDIVAVLNDPQSASAVHAERAFLTRLEGSCRTPIAGHAQIVAGQLSFKGQVLSPDGQHACEAAADGDVASAAAIGLAAADDILRRADPRALARSSA